MSENPSPLCLEIAGFLRRVSLGVIPQGAATREARELFEKLDADSLAGPRWIPVSERLPEGGAFCAVVSEDRAVECAFLDGGSWYDYRHDEIIGPVTHWMPLPAPPEGA